MSRKVRSIKNEIVDFDLFDIKEQISRSPKTSDVLMRENYIDIKRRRSPRKDVDQLLAEQEKNKAMVRKRMKDQQKKQQEESKTETSVVESKEVETKAEDTSVEQEKPKAQPKKKKRVIKK